MATPVSPTLSETEISDSYIYLLSRLLVLRQQQLDFQEGFKWNALLHRKPGEVDWPNPNLDVASKAWVAVDEKSCLVVSVPKITGRPTVAIPRATRFLSSVHDATYHQPEPARCAAACPRASSGSRP